MGLILSIILFKSVGRKQHKTSFSIENGGNNMTEKVNQYIKNMRSAIGMHLINPDSIYYGKAGHERLARECGYALNDFNESERKELLSCSYSSIYIIGCNLKPILNASEWINIMKSQLL